MAWDIIVILVVELVRRGLQDAIRSSSVEKLRAHRSVLCWKPSNGNRVHPIDAQKPSTCASILGEGLKIDSISIPGDLFGEGVDAYTVFGSKVPSVLVNKGVYQSISCSVAPGKPRELPGEGVGNELAIIQRVGIIHDPVGFSWEPERSRILV